MGTTASNNFDAGKSIDGIDVEGDQADIESNWFQNMMMNDTTRKSLLPKNKLHKIEIGGQFGGEESINNDKDSPNSQNGENAKDAGGNANGMKPPSPVQNPNISIDQDYWNILKKNTKRYSKQEQEQDQFKFETEGLLRKFKKTQVHKVNSLSNSDSTNQD